MKRTTIFATLTALLPLTAHAAPYCEALLDADKLEKRYQRLAPIHSDATSGWIFTSDQLKTDYEMPQHRLDLMQAVVSSFLDQGIDLAIMVAPPRPVIAGQQVVDATLGSNGAFDVAEAEASFEALLAQLRQTGATVPNLLDIAQQPGAHPFYFRGDTHWTNAGAGQSALALATELGHDAAFQLSEVAPAGTFEERGSLNDIVAATCGQKPQPEAAQQFDYTSVSARDAADLLAPSAATPTTLLLGTSFSNRYKRDQYQAADALASALKTDLMNHSVSGGGSIGPLEALALSGALADTPPKLIIWEFPYTNIPNTSALRQILGALQAHHSHAPAGSDFSLKGDRVSMPLPQADPNATLLRVRLDSPKARWLKVDLAFAKGKTKTVQLRRKKVMGAAGEHADWWVDIRDLGPMAPTSLRLRVDPKAKASGGQLSLASAPQL